MPIKQPKNTKNKFGANLVWSNTFGQERTQRLNVAQSFIDSECIRLMDKHTPKLNKQLVKSPVLGTKIGSGRIIYANPYARFQYYGKVMVSSVTGSSYARNGESKVLTSKNLKYTSKLARPFWFETMKTQHGEAILRGAARLAGGKPK